jgi:hypothetical protein
MLTTKVLNACNPGQTAKFVLDGVYTNKIRNKYPHKLLFDHDAARAERMPGAEDKTGLPNFLTGSYFHVYLLSHWMRIREHE